MVSEPSSTFVFPDLLSALVSGKEINGLSGKENDDGRVNDDGKLNDDGKEGIGSNDEGGDENIDDDDDDDDGDGDGGLVCDPNLLVRVVDEGEVPSPITFRM